MNLKKSLIIIAIAVIYALFIGYGIEVFHDSPKSEEFCPNVYNILNQEDCVAAGGTWRPQYCENGVATDSRDIGASGNAEGSEAKAIKPSPVPVSTFGYCETKSSCYEDFALVMSNHNKIVFIVAAIFGILAVVAGMILKKEGVNDGFVAGGIILILYGTIRYWQHANDILKFVLLGIVLSVLIWIGYKKLDSRQSKK
ncbi:hypothetical protein HYT52_01085 [Candidatus Woesearchaeota archaeon]|nr:hypothetical protein [Candidatus Woesearchaeota archaeon]